MAQEFWVIWESREVLLFEKLDVQWWYGMFWMVMMELGKGFGLVL